MIEKININNFEYIYESITNFRKKISLIQKIVTKNDKKFLPILIKILDGEKHNWVIATLVKAIGYLGNEKIIPVIKPYLKHKDTRIRANAIEGLEYINSSKIVPIVAKCLSDPDNRVKANAIKCLNKFGNLEVKKYIEQMITSKKEDTIYSAIFALKVIGNDYAVERLYKILKESPSFRIRYRTKNAIIELAITGNKKANYILQNDEIFIEELFYENIRNIKDKREFIGRDIIWIAEVKNYFDNEKFYLIKDSLCHDWIILLLPNQSLIENELIEINGKIIDFLNGKYPVIKPKKITRLI